MPVGGQGDGGPDGAPDMPAHIISRLYECLAQVCSALGLFSMAAFFYAHSVEIVRHLPPGAPACLAPHLHLPATRRGPVCRRAHAAVQR